MEAAHRLKFLHLVRCEDGSKLIVRLLKDRAGLLAALLRCETGIGMECGHLLLLIGQNRLEFRCLVGGEAKAFSKVLSGLLGIELVMTMVTRLPGRLLSGSVVCGLLRGLLAEGDRGCECNGQS